MFQTAVRWSALNVIEICIFDGAITIVRVLINNDGTHKVMQVAGPVCHIGIIGNYGHCYEVVSAMVTIAERMIVQENKSIQAVFDYFSNTYASSASNA